MNTIRRYVEMQKYYYKDGFTSDTCAEGSGLLKYTAAAVTITKGQAIHSDGSGLATNATTAFAATFLGIAAHDCTSGEALLVIPPRQNYKFWVKVESNEVLDQANVGEIVDLEANDSIDISDTTCVAWGFHILAIDISADAIAANTYGYAKGELVVMDQD